MNRKTKKTASLFAFAAAALYAVNIPVSKILLKHIGAVMTAGLLYLGAGIGMLALKGIGNALTQTPKRERFSKKEIPYVISMVLLDIAAPILLMIGITKTNSANVSLLNNFEIVATSLIALVIFKEAISKKLWISIALVTLAGAVLSFEGGEALSFNSGSLFVLGACVCWGFENNCTKMLSNSDARKTVIIKGLFSGMGSLVIALIKGETFPVLKWLFVALLLGFVSYGLSIYFYIRAQKDLGAARTSAYYSVAPFFGVAFSFAFLGERPTLNFYIALLLMIVSTVLNARDTVASEK